MHFDALTLACVADELRGVVCPGKVQQVLLVDERSVGLEVYAQGKRHNLLLVANPSAGRVHLVSGKLRRGPEQPTPLLLLLRKYLRNALLSAISLPAPYERVLRLDFQHAEHGATALLAEFIGKQSNLIFINAEGRILDCVHRVTTVEEHGRKLGPGYPYRLPPAQTKLPPLDDGSDTYYDRLVQIVPDPGPLFKALVAHIAGVSPTQGREIAWRVCGDAQAPAGQASITGLVTALQALWIPLHTGEWQPGLWIDGARVTGYSCYVGHLAGDFQPLPSISQAIERFYSEPRQETAQTLAEVAQDAYAVQRGQVRSLLEQARKRLRRQLEALASDEPAPGEAEGLRTQAEWLLALHDQVEAGQQKLTVDLGDGNTLDIPLDASLSAVTQAQQLFKRAARLERAALFIPQRRQQIEMDVDFVEQLANDLTLASNQPEIAAIRSELVATGLAPEKAEAKAHVRQTSTQPAKEGGQPLRFTSPTQITILVGKNARQNDHLTFALAHPLDLWLHVRGAPGAHVVIRSQGRPVNEATLQMAAQLAIYHSSLRGERSAPVTVCERRFVHRVPGGRPGQATIRNEQVIFASGELPDVKAVNSF
jgi:predicted ribosome quality control (RQC) complex YloA/Tae2 family protein